MNSASPPKAAVTGIRVVRVSCELGVFALPAGRAGEHLCSRSGGAHAVDVKAGPGEQADRVDSPGVAGQRGCLGVGEEDRALLGDGMAGASDADHGDHARARGRCERQPRAERGGIAGDYFVGSGGWASGAQHVGGERGA